MDHVSKEKLMLINSETEKDKEIQDLIKVIKEGWPQDKKELKNEIKPFWKYRDELTEMRGIVYRGSRISIPKTDYTTLT